MKKKSILKTIFSGVVATSAILMLAACDKTVKEKKYSNEVKYSEFGEKLNKSVNDLEKYKGGFTAHVEFINEIKTVSTNMKMNATMTIKYDKENEIEYTESVYNVLGTETTEKKQVQKEEDGKTYSYDLLKNNEKKEVDPIFNGNDDEFVDNDVLDSFFDVFDFVDLEGGTGVTTYIDTKGDNTLYTATLHDETTGYEGVVQLSFDDDGMEFYCDINGGKDENTILLKYSGYIDFNNPKLKKIEA